MLFRKAGSSPHKKLQLRCWRRPLMVRHPYSEAVQSDEEERFPLLPWGEKTEMRGGPSLKGKGGLVGFRKKQRASNPLSNPWVKAGSSPHKNPQLRCWRRPLMVRQPYSVAVWAPSRAVGTSPVPWGERGLGKAVDPPLRVREDWWVFEDLLRFK